MGKGRSAEKGALWLVPTLWSVYMDQQQFILGNIRALLKRLGLGPQTTKLLFVFGAFALAGGVAFYMQYKAKAEAEAKAEEAEEALANADAAREQSLLGEMTCRPSGRSWWRSSATSKRSASCWPSRCSTSRRRAPRRWTSPAPAWRRTTSWPSTSSGRIT